MAFYNQDKFVQAARDGDLNKVRDFVERQSGSISINAHNNSGDTALCCAAYAGRSDVVRYLLEHGACTDIPGHDGQTALYWARHNQKDHTAGLLLRAELERQAREKPEWVLFSATKLAHVEISPALERKLTEIFNFASRERLTIIENLKSDQETILPVASFDDLPPPAVEQALTRFRELGGKADGDFVLHGGVLRLDKDKPRP